MPLDESNYASVIAELYRGVGWGILEIECDPETYEGKIIVKDSFIADMFGAADQPVCAFMSGYFAGYLTEYFGKAISVREVSCKATGKKFCEHIISLATLRRNKPGISGKRGYTVIKQPNVDPGK